MPNEAGTIIDEAGSPSQPVTSGDGDLVSTTEFMASPVDDADSTSGADDKAQGTPGAQDTPPDEGAGKEAGDDADPNKAAGEGDDRFDKHPRFVELNDRMKAAETRAANAEAKVTVLGDKVNESFEGKKGEGDLPYKDVGKMSDEEVQEWQDDDPKGFYSNMLLQAKHEVGQEMKADMSSRTMEDAIAGTYEDYAKKNSDFDQMWDSGELKIFMDKNPGHNAISAHMALTAGKKQTEAIEDAVKAAEKRIMNNLKAKGKSSVLGAGPSSSARAASDSPPELKDTTKHGGLNAVLAQRSLARDQARMG